MRANAFGRHVERKKKEGQKGSIQADKLVRESLCCCCCAHCHRFFILWSFSFLHRQIGAAKSQRARERHQQPEHRFGKRKANAFWFLPSRTIQNDLLVALRARLFTMLSVAPSQSLLATAMYCHDIMCRLPTK